MKPVRLLPPLAALLLASACGSPAPTNEAGNDAAALANDAALNDDLAAANDIGAEDAAPVAVAAPPAPASDLSADDAAPLVQATQVAREIDSDPTVERVPYQDGWAWRRGGQIIRTASRDGRRVSYFRPGDAAPFFVQQGDQGFAYSGGRPQRAYDRSGRPAQVDTAQRSAAQRLADQSRHDRDEAEHARPDRGDHGSGHGGPGSDRQSPDQAARPGGEDHRTPPARPGADDHARPGAPDTRSDHGRPAPDRHRPGQRDADTNGQHPQGN